MLRFRRRVRAASVLVALAVLAASAAPAPALSRLRGILFDRNATWKDAPRGVLSWGYPIMPTHDQLRRDFEFAIRRTP